MDWSIAQNSMSVSLWGVHCCGVYPWFCPPPQQKQHIVTVLAQFLSSWRHTISVAPEWAYRRGGILRWQVQHPQTDCTLLPAFLWSPTSVWSASRWPPWCTPWPCLSVCPISSGTRIANQCVCIISWLSTGVPGWCLSSPHRAPHTYNEHFWPCILCDDSLDLTSPCWRGICVNCQLKNKFTIEKSNADTVFWKEGIKTETGHLRIDQKQGCVGELKDLFSEFSFFKEHVRIKRIQSTAFTEDKKRSDCHVLQCDFAMAYSCDYQNEVQSA